MRPVKDSHGRISITHFRIRPLSLHKSFTRTGTCVRLGMAVTVTYSRYKLVTVSLPKRLLGGRFASETAMSRKSLDMTFFLRRRRRAWLSRCRMY
jgi:hypothetical protein